ncbi:50S ribosomal protein L7/L12 [bacterium]|nr:50S ribosomal protein L7/L12 [Chloroflexi bacterium CFX6]RIL09347.1 MAG: 50S ribosomal protein L7/L12 [bacterium]
MADLETIVQELDKLTLLEASQLVKQLEDHWGVSAAAPVMMGAMPMMGGGAGAAEAVEEQTQFDVILDDVGAQKIQVIKAIRVVKPDLGLKEAKDLVEGAPATVASGVSKEEAESIKSKLEAEGAKVSIK